MVSPKLLLDWWASPSKVASLTRQRLRRLHKRVFLPRLECLEERTLLSVVPWNGPITGGDWGTAGNWTGGVLPKTTDTALIGAGNTVTVSSSDTIQVATLDVEGGLNVTGGNLTVGNTAGSNFTETTGGTVMGAGSINIVNGASNSWSGGTMTGTGTTTFTSGSLLTISGTTDVLAGGWTLGGVSATLTGALNTGSGGGTLNFSALQWTTGGGVDLVGNTLTNAGTIDLTNPSTSLPLYANNNFTGGGAANLGGTLNNIGTIVQQGAGSLQLFDSVILSNRGVYQFTTDSSVLFGNDAPTFVNTATGTVKKTTTTGTSSFTVPFNNQGGIVDAESGTLRLAAGGISTGGTYNANGSGTIDLTGGSNPTFTGTYTGSGTGLVQLASGTLTVGSSSATFNFPSGLFVFSGGTLNGSTLTNSGAITISGGTLGGTLANQGTITQTGGTLALNGSLNNAGLYNIALAATGTAITNGGIFTNTTTGTLELSTNVIATLLNPFANQGGMVATTAAVTSGTLVLSGGGSSSGGTYNATSAGAFIDLAGNNTSNLTGSYSGTGNGTVGLTQGGVLAVSSSNSNSSSATIAFTAEVFQISSGNFDLRGNSLTNSGTITLSNDTTGSTPLIYDNTNGAVGEGGTCSTTRLVVQQALRLSATQRRRPVLQLWHLPVQRGQQHPLRFRRRQFRQHSHRYGQEDRCDRHVQY